MLGRVVYLGNPPVNWLSSRNELGPHGRRPVSVLRHNKGPVAPGTVSTR